MNNTIITLISGFLIVLGTLGAVLPFLPGLPLALGGLILYALVSKTMSVWGLVIFGILTLLTIVVDVFAPAIAAKGHKASKMGVTGAVIGGVIGIFVLGPIGILLGPFIGAFVGEIINHASTDRALRIAVASLFGLVIGSAFKLIVGMGMFIYFLIKVF